MARFAVFFVVMISLMIGLGFYVGVRLIPVSWTPAARGLAWAVLALLIAVQPAAMASRFVFGRSIDALSWVGFLSMGLFVLALTGTLLRDLAWLGVRAGGGLPVDESRRQALFDSTSAAVLALAGAAGALGLVRALSRPSIVFVTVPIANLPAALEGFTIAQISDVHVGPLIKKSFIEAIVTTVNSIDADLIAVTGDIVDGSVLELRGHTAPLAGLRARHGAFFVTGNHEYYSGALEWIAEMQRLGITALVNSHTVIDHDGAPVVIAGVTDHQAGGLMPEHESDPHLAMAGAPLHALKVLLAHQPRSAYQAEKAGFDLQLSGHTHGGQLFPATLLVRLLQPFVEGLHRLGSMWVYTNRGTGYWGPPMRHTSSPSEVTKLVLVRLT